MTDEEPMLLRYKEFLQINTQKTCTGQSQKKQ